MIFVFIIMGFLPVINPITGRSNPIQDQVKKYIYNSDLEHKKIVYAQAILETGWFRCGKDVGDPCSMDRNNLFGWYYKKKYLEFGTWKESVDYYVRWQDRHYNGGDYYEFLDQVGFATGDRYTDKLKSIVNMLNDEK